jgi:hypothetical protein
LSFSQFIIFIFFIQASWASETAVRSGAETTIYNIGDIDEVGNEMDKAFTHISSLPLSDVQNNKKAPDSDKNCAARYGWLYGKPAEAVTDFTVAFGFDDAIPKQISTDRNFRLQLIAKMMEPCGGRKNIYLCGFKRPTGSQWGAESDEVYAKEIVDAEGKKRFVRFQIVNGSWANDFATIQKNQDQQNELSAHVEEVFLNGLKKSDAVFYLGHSRKDGGPCFDMPHLTSEGEVDYAYYEQTRKDHTSCFDRMISALASRKGKDGGPKIISMASCKSKKFMKDLKGVAPDSIYQMVNGYAYAEDWSYSLIGTLNSMLGLVCDPGLSDSITSPLMKPDSSNQMRFYEPKYQKNF